MNPNMRIVLIPAYNPGNQILDLVNKAEFLGLKIIIINDGSDSNYSQLFETLSKKFIVLIHSENYGKGKAIKTGLQYIKRNFETPYTVVTMDADGQHKVDDALNICIISEENPNTLVLGSRAFQENVPIKSQLGNTLTRYVYSFSTGLHLQDTQTGLRAFSNNLLPIILDIPGTRYEFEMNVLLEFARRNIPIKEVEISTIYFNNNSGSHFNPLKDSYKIYKEIIKFSASSLISFLLDFFLYSIMIVLTSSLGTVISTTISNISARIISATMNYTINKKLVFNSSETVFKSASKYFLLALTILIGNTVFLGILINQMKINIFIAKLITELTFFIFSWLTQRLFIFKRKDI